MRSSSGIRLVAAALLLASATASFAADSATGTMTVNGKKATLHYAYARTEPDFFDKKETNVVLLISSVPVTPEQFADQFALGKLVETNQLAGVMVSINKDKQVVSGTIFSPELTKYNGSFSATGMHNLETTTFTQSAIAGKMSMAKEDDFFGTKYIYDSTFEATVKATAKSVGSDAKPVELKGKPLPAGGGEPGKVYLAYTKSLVAGDVAAVGKAVTAEREKQMHDPDFSKMFPLIQMMEPKNIKVTGGAVDGDRATLIITGTSDEKAATGTVLLKRENGAWKIAEESWSM